MRIAVRPAETKDVEWLVGELKRFADFFGSKRKLFPDEAHARTSLMMMVDHHVVLVAEADEIQPLGFIGGILTPHMFNPEIIVLAEMFWWVQPEHRGTRAGLMLLNAFDEIGKEKAHWVTMALEHHSPVAERHLARRGFKLNERSFLKEVG